MGGPVAEKAAFEPMAEGKRMTSEQHGISRTALWPLWTCGEHAPVFTSPLEAQEKAEWECPTSQPSSPGNSLNRSVAAVDGSSDE